MLSDFFLIESIMIGTKLDTASELVNTTGSDLRGVPLFAFIPSGAYAIFPLLRSFHVQCSLGCIAEVTSRYADFS